MSLNYIPIKGVIASMIVKKSHVCLASFRFFLWKDFYINHEKKTVPLKIHILYLCFENKDIKIKAYSLEVQQILRLWVCFKGTN